ncbi:MAG: tRNA guanosine(34) transglycosylase Tgt [Holophagaceae bacterium]|jgi:queuine tRNA-ribosyltransferase
MEINSLWTDAAPNFKFALEAQQGEARVGQFMTSHGVVSTPAFMPVGTQATVKSITPDQLKGIQPEVVLANTYHLHLRPGAEIIESLGGLHRFMNWDGPLLTDSGGFQVFSLASMRKISEDGVTFQSHLDGSTHHLTPEKSIEIQRQLGADIVMAFDECPAAGLDRASLEISVNRTTRWLTRCRGTPLKKHQGLFAINQGGTYLDLRKKHLEDILALDRVHPFEGFAIGGLSVGEPKEAMETVLRDLLPNLPRDRPRYLMGVGTPEDILKGIELGVDLFDCVSPSREARHGRLLTSYGRVNIKNAMHRRSEESLDPQCRCYTCQGFSKAYLHHLMKADEFLGLTLNTIHNLSYTVNLARSARIAIQKGQWASFVQATQARWQSLPESL